jgi:hypothetical protein
MNNSKQLPVNYNLFISPTDSNETNDEVKEIRLVTCNLLNTTEYEVFSFYKSISKIIEP